MAPNWKTSPTHRRLGASRGQAVTSRSGGAERTYEDLYRSVYLPMYDRLKPLYREIRRITGYPPT